MADSGDVESDDIIDERAVTNEELVQFFKDVYFNVKHSPPHTEHSPPHTEERMPPPSQAMDDFLKRHSDIPLSSSEINNEHNWDNLNEREQFILIYIKKNGKFYTDNFEIVNKAWSENLGTVTQSRFSQIISTLIDEKWLEKIGSRGTGSSRILIVPPNVESCIGRLDIENIRKKPSKSYKRWNSEQEDMLKSLLKTGKSIPHIARKMCRTHSSIRSRIFALGLNN